MRGLDSDKFLFFGGRFYKYFFLSSVLFACFIGFTAIFTPEVSAQMHKKIVAFPSNIPHISGLYRNELFKEKT